MKITTKKEHFTNPLYLQSGRILEPYEIAYEAYGELNEARDNVILVCHALSGSHHAAGTYEGEKKPGWWDKMIGDGKALDTRKYYVICTNVIGSCFGSTGPMSKMYPSEHYYRFKFPVVTIQDMVKAQRILLDRLKIDKVKAIIGGSMGGMQALRFAVDYPNFAETIIPISTTYATSPNVIAANRIMMEAITNDEHFKNGNYDPKEFHESESSGLAVARMIGFLHYLAPAAYEQKFGRKYVNTDGIFELFGRFEVERYLEYNGYNFTKFFDPLSYLYIIKAISIFDLGDGFDSLDDALARIKTRVELIAFSGDLMFLPKEMRIIKERLEQQNSTAICNYHEIASDYGHDGFLVEIEKYENLIKEILEGK